MANIELNLPLLRRIETRSKTHPQTSHLIGVIFAFHRPRSLVERILFQTTPWALSRGNGTNDR